MKTGKLPENVLKRSVLGQIRSHRNEVIKGAGVGEDCAFLALKNNGCEEQKEADKKALAAVSTEMVTLPVKNASYLAVMAGANNLAAAGARPLAATLAVTLPPETEETQLKEIMNGAERCCEEWKMQIAGGHTEISPSVKTPIIAATVVGTISEMEKICERPYGIGGNSRKADGYQQTVLGEKAGCLEIVMSKWIGLEGTSIIAGEKKAELSKRYPSILILAAEEQKKYLSIAQEAAIARKFGACTMHDIRNGGIFGALWELGQRMGAGFCVELKKIPIKQETIEVCEFFGLNPYELLSGGALLMVTEDGNGLVKSLKEAGIFSAVIGSICSGNDRVIKNGEETRYLGFPQPDEIFKLTFD